MGGRLETVPPEGGTLNVFVKPAELMASGRKGAGFAWDLNREYIQKYKVITRNKYVGPNGACYCPGIPLPYAQYNFAAGLEYDPAALAVKFEAQLQEDDEASWNVWIVTVTYSTTMPEGGVPAFPEVGADGKEVFSPGEAGGPRSAGRARRLGAQTRPDMVAPIIEWDEEVIHRSPPKDLNGNPFVNAAYIPITPAPVFEFPYNVLTVIRNEISFDPDGLLEYAMVYNEDMFLGAPPGCAQCLVAKAKLKFHGLTYYHEVTYRIRFTPKIMVPNEDYNPDDPDDNPERRIRWDDIESTFLEAGTDELWYDKNMNGPPKSRWRPIRGSDGLPVTSPRPLYGETCPDENLIGTAIPVDKLRDEDATDDKPYYKTFRIREFKPFTGLFTRGLQIPLTKLMQPVGTAVLGPRYYLTDPIT